MTHRNRVALATALLASSAGSVCAHDWYPLSCCSEKDCRPLVEEKGETDLESASGWKLWDGRIIPRDSAKISPDRRFPLCETLSPHILCFFAPPGGA